MKNSNKNVRLALLDGNIYGADEIKKKILRRLITYASPLLV